MPSHSCSSKSANVRRLDYVSAVVGIFLLFVCGLWFFKRGTYEGPVRIQSIAQALLLIYVSSGSTSSWAKAARTIWSWNWKSNLRQWTRMKVSPFNTVRLGASD